MKRSVSIVIFSTYMATIFGDCVLLSILCLGGLTVARAQTGSFSGRITNQKGGEPLPNASIVLSAISRGAISDALGNFKINGLPPASYSVDVSFIGYEVTTRKIVIESGKNSILNVRLTPGSIQLADVTVMAESGKNLNSFSAIDIKLRPINTSQDVLRMIPGLFIAQHAGGGKAEQIFLRGFDLDHGTDINLSVDGLPVNMVSHAHGQGYADLHFIIPETIGTVDFNKGPYYADKGNFTTAGYAAFKTKNVLDRNTVKFEMGRFGQARGLALINLLPNLSNSASFKQNAYVASEFSHADGYFQNSQNFKRLNVMGKYTAWWHDRDIISVTLSTFDSRWYASGQIPDRAIESGTISRFGSIDPTEGGNTRRTNASVKQTHTFSQGGVLENQVYFTKYDFNLYSNFTFFLKDPINGDQINQSENRNIVGYNASYRKESSLFGKKTETYLGSTFRRDKAGRVRLAHTVKRQYLEDLQSGDVGETNAAAFISETIDLNSKFSINGTFRFDQFVFDYNDKLNFVRQSQKVGLLSPKMSLNYTLNSNTLIYVKAGRGFHSNDTRVVVAKRGKEILPKAIGLDIGMVLKPIDLFVLNAAVWMLDLQQEFVYVGDEGIVEPGGRTRREGVDLSFRYQLNPWLFADLDMNATHPRSKDAPAGQNYIPLAPVISSIGGLSVRNSSGWNGSLRYRFLGNRPATEDYALTAKGYLLMDAIVNYTRPKFEVGLSAENLLNNKWKEAQFATTSRLKNESTEVTEIHFTPGSPFFLKARMSFFF